GHHGEVRALAFAPAEPGKEPLLVSAALEFNKKKPEGSVRLWNVATKEKLALLEGLPAYRTLPGLAVWHLGKELKQVRVALAWMSDSKNKSKLVLWDPASAGEALRPEHGILNGPLADLGKGRIVSGFVLPGERDVLTGRLRLHFFGTQEKPDTRES